MLFGCERYSLSVLEYSFANTRIVIYFIYLTIEKTSFPYLAQMAEVCFPYELAVEAE